ncbi:MAG: putative CAMK family protein kinase [Streblomastix strix]|uniref:non-specific serine/threonine protein kinase n=1 Tax=Streblomastix strix TaxID=222440 RepID=A0A5J4X3A2_9EUKA|nr:MAG: putative CAMK family protein kinase [Streblomastix strix]
MSKQSDYQIIRALGHGAFGTTFLVVENATGKQCAWKRITITSDEDRRLAQLELEMLQRVRGDYLVQFLGSFEDKHEFFIMMEYCDKGDLRKYMNDLIERESFPSVDEIWNILTQMVEALHSLHEMDIIHRDFKPENVFLTGENHVKIGDFELARIAQQTQQYYTKVGGTTVYFSPELLEEEEDESDSGSDSDFNKIHKRPTFVVVQTQESDVFALGEICYELIVLKHPFAGKQGKITNKRIKKCTPKQLPSRISEQLKQIVMAMLNKDPARRPTTGQLLEHPEIARRIIQQRRDSNIQLENQMQTSKQVDSTISSAQQSSLSEIQQINSDSELRYQLKNLILIVERLTKPLIGTKNQITGIIKEQERACQIFNDMFQNYENEKGRKYAIEFGIVDLLLHILTTYELNQITVPFCISIYSFTSFCSRDIRLQLIQKKPYPALVRILSLADAEAAGYAISSIHNLVIEGIANFDDDDEPNQHFDLIQRCNGASKIYELFLRNISKATRDCAAACIGLIYRAKEIGDAQMRSDIIQHLKFLICSDSDEQARKASVNALNYLACNQAFVAFTDNCEHESSIILSKNTSLYPALIRLISHPHETIASNAISSVRTFGTFDASTSLWKVVSKLNIVPELHEFYISVLLKLEKDSRITPAFFPAFNLCSFQLCDDNSFNGFRILVVCLYIGAVLKKKGFTYSFVCSYGDGLKELQRVDKERCPYSQLWLFSSEGDGELPDEALDKDINKVAPFLEATVEFWKNGGGLFLFCDNHPYNFEPNHLLQNHFNFTHEGRNGVSVVRFGENYLGKNQIKVAPSENITHSSFSPKVHLEAPGPSKKRISLRLGLIKFSEGNTISFAVDEKVRPLTTAEQLWPFTAFAWTSENVDPLHPFIQFFDPKISKESEASYCSETCQGSTLSPGPIVLLGGFTSAFSEFGEDEKGSGRLVVSITCWLTRYEERFYAHRTSGSEILTTTPALTKHYSVPTFNGFGTKPVIIHPRYSILMLDGSGSMGGQPYQKLIEAAKGNIDIQTQNNGIMSIISFQNTAQIINEKQKRRLANNEGYYGQNTFFNLALQSAVQIAQRNPPEYECKVVFFTDGGNNGGDFTGSANWIHQMKVRIDAVVFGGADENALKLLIRGEGRVSVEKQWMMLHKLSI